MGLFDKLEGLAFGANSKQSSQSSENMYPQELESLINIAIKDGTITDKERLVLYKKAAKYDIDPDELDMVLESRLSSGCVTDSSPAQPELLKRKGPKKCSSCGAILSDLNAVHCPYCGYKVVNIVRDILDEINLVVPPKKVQQNSGFFGKIVDFIESEETDRKLLQQKKDVILSYNIPIVKEVVLEFLAFSVQKGCKVDSEHDFWHDDLGEAWYKKSEQVIAEARLVFSHDSELMAVLKDYAIKFGMEKRGLFRR